MSEQSISSEIGTVSATPVSTTPAIVIQPSKVTIDTAITEVKLALKDLLGNSQQNAKLAETQLQRFIESIQPSIEQALVSGDTMSLGYLRDQVIIRAGRVSLGTIYQQRVIVANTIITVVRVLIRVALGAI